MNKFLEDYRKTMPLENRLTVLYEMTLHTFLVDTGCVPDGFWNDEKEEKYGTAFRAQAKVMAKAAIKEFDEWEEDGRPKKE